MHRKNLISTLKTQTQTKTENSLMNELQERGLVSDEAESLSHVPDGDLIRAMNKLNQEG